MEQPPPSLPPVSQPQHHGIIHSHGVEQGVDTKINAVATSSGSYSGSIISDLEWRRARLQHVITVLTVLGLAIAVYEVRICAGVCASTTSNDLVCVLQPPPDSCSSGKSSILKGMNTLLSLVAVGMIIRYHIHLREMDLAVQLLTSWQGGGRGRGRAGGNAPWNWARRRPFLVDLVVCLLHCPPGVSFIVPVTINTVRAEYRVETVAVLLMFMRLWFLWRSYRDHIVAGYRVSRFASKTLSVHINSIFVLRASYHLNPIWPLTVGTSIVTMTFSFFILIAESPKSLVQVTTGENISEQRTLVLSDFTNCLWFVFATLTSTGYGDIVPLTVVGQVVTLFLMLAGQVIVSIFTVSLLDMFQFKAQEAKASRFMEGHTWRKQLRTESVRLLQMWFRSGYQRRAPVLNKQLRRIRKQRADFFNWMHQDPHRGLSIDTIDRIHKMLNENVTSLTTTFDNLTLPFSQWLREKEKNDRPRKELQKRTGHTEVLEEDVVIFGQLANQRNRVEQLLRAVVFLTAKEKKDSALLLSCTQEVKLIAKELNHR